MQSVGGAEHGAERKAEVVGEGGTTFSPCPAGLRYIHGMPVDKQEWPAKGEELSTATKKLRWETTVPVLVPGDGDVVVCGGSVVVPGKGGEVGGAGE